VSTQRALIFLKQADRVVLLVGGPQSLERMASLTWRIWWRI
jgi:hypothetical protein